MSDILEQPSLPIPSDFAVLNTSGFPCNCSSCKTIRVNRLGTRYGLVDVYGHPFVLKRYQEASSGHTHAKERWDLRLLKMKVIPDWLREFCKLPVDKTENEKTGRIPPCVYKFVNPDEMMEITRAMCDDAHKRVHK